MEKPASFLVDGIKAIAKHNGVIRIEFMRLDVVDGKPYPSVELQVPAASMQSVVDALKKLV
jgi:hypothetical protein